MRGFLLEGFTVHHLHLEGLGGRADRRDDAVVAAAAAERPLEGVGDLGFGRVGLAEEQGVGLEDHARRAVAALEGAVVGEGLLERVEAAVAGFEKAISLDPEFGFAVNQLAYVHAKAGRYAEALRLFERYAAIDPGDANPIDSIAELYVRMGRLDLAEMKYREALERKPGFFSVCASLYYVGLLKEDYAAAGYWLDEFDRLAPTPLARALGEFLRAFMDYFLGRGEDALARFAGIRKQAEAAEGAATVAFVDWITAFILRDRGETAAANEAYQRSFELRSRGGAALSPLDEVGRLLFRGWVDLAAGAPDVAVQRAAEIEPLLASVSPADAAQAVFWHKLLTAESALAANDIDRAIVVGRELVSPNFPNMDYESVTVYNMPLLKDVLARAYWKKGDLDAAAAEYRKLMTIDPSNQVRMMISPLYHYRLGCVLEEKGDRTGAVVEYRKFLDHWKAADPTHPEPADARRRLAAFGDR